ncbi:MAG: response regulator [Planctomycetota bacterium]
MKPVEKIKEKVLVVDDEEVICQSVKKILAKKNFEVDKALSASEALNMMKKEHYSVVVTDLMMPKITGMQLLKEIKKSKPETAVIMITGYATIKTAVQAIKLGAFDYIPKPFTPEELTSVTIRAIERTRIYKKEKVPVAEEIPIEKTELSPVEITEEKEEKEELSVEGNFYCIPEHSWARVENSGIVRVGMEDMFQRTVGEIVNIDLPYEGDEVVQGDVCVRVTSSNLHIHKLWSPVSGKVVKVNESLNKDYSLAKQYPRGKGWFIKVKPMNLESDIENLVYIKPAIKLKESK